MSNICRNDRLMLSQGVGNRNQSFHGAFYLLIKYFACFAGVFMCLISSSCIDERFSTDPTLRLSFSHDTVSFDTIFTSIPSRTMRILVFNRHKEALNISSVRLLNGENSLFRYNLDGRVPPPSTVITDVAISANDSLFLFIETTLDASNDSLPVFFQDRLEFVVNGTPQQIILESYGQNAVIFRSRSFDSNVSLTNHRPYLIFDYLHITEGHTLTIEAGARLYFHKNAHLIVDGNLVVNGTQAQSVQMHCDRFDASPEGTPYIYMPNQWGNIYLQNPTGQHRIDHACIRGGNLGILLIGAARSAPKLTITNSIIQNMGHFGIYAQGAQLSVENSEIANCGYACLNILGGSTAVTQSTIANYFEFGSRNDAAVAIANVVTVDEMIYLYPVSSATIENSIIFGNAKEELVLRRDSLTDALFNVSISQCLIKGKKNEASCFQNILWSYEQNPVAGKQLADTVFINTTISNLQTHGYYNFQLDPHSRARNVANATVAARYPVDLSGKNRLADGMPDLGAYER
ncbi:MAG: right-handed parallel beta-helix repeat-containing protein [Prevotellaceae bacterium]|jgi:hypothetical protein|nr:right-handed parallel beta-helix repeat-containing protein [Prevotellaceae bacterium]